MFVQVTEGTDVAVMSAGMNSDIEFGRAWLICSGK